MNSSLLTTARQMLRDRGLSAVMVQGLKKVVAPFARVGSVYFLERDLSTPMPPIQPPDGFIVREGSWPDLPLLDAIDDNGRHRQQAVERLNRGEVWFIAIESATGRLANYRWVSLSGGFIPELGMYVNVKPKQAYFYDLETLPQFRRRGIEAVTRQFSYNTMHQKYGMDRIVVYICADNHASLQAGRKYLTSIGRVWYVRRGEIGHVYTPANERLPELSLAPVISPQAARLARTSSSRR